MNKLPVVLVAGPSGAGKSTFIDQLVSGRLPPDIERELPEGAAAWPLIVPPAVRLPPNTNGGVVVHYDTTYVVRAKLDGYEHHSTAKIFQQTASLAIVYIRPDFDRLLAQFEARDALRPRSHRLWAHFVREPIRHLVSRLKGSGNLRETRTIYRDRDLLSSCYTEWERYMKSLIQGKPQSLLLCVEPVLDDDGNPTFRLVEKIRG